MANPLTKKKPGMGKSVWDRLRWRSHWYRKTGSGNMVVGESTTTIRYAIEAVRRTAAALMDAIEEEVRMATNGNGDPAKAAKDVDDARLALQAALNQLAEVTSRFGAESEGSGGLGDQGASEEAAEDSWKFSYAEQMKLITAGEIDRQHDRASAGSRAEAAEAAALGSQVVAGIFNAISEQNARTAAGTLRLLGDQTDFNARTAAERGRHDRTAESSVDTQEKMGEDTTRELSRGVPERASDEAQAKK